MAYKLWNPEKQNDVISCDEIDVDSERTQSDLGGSTCHHSTLSNDLNTKSVITKHSSGTASQPDRTVVLNDDKHLPIILRKLMAIS